jgi:hypothetical protein
MDVGPSMLEPAADMALKNYRFGDPNVMDLTLDQIATIKPATSIVDLGDCERKQGVGVILANRRPYERRPPGGTTPADPPIETQPSALAA